MNNSIEKGLQNKGIIIPLDFYSLGCSQYPLLNAITSQLHPPVTMIQSQIQSLKKFCNYLDISLLNETFSLCEDSIENIHGFIEKINFLCTSDIKLGKLKPRWFSLRLLINQVFAELRYQDLDISRIQLNNSAADYNIFPDKSMLIRVMVNLLSNALKFSSREVELFIATTGIEFSIVVRDSGIGIPENQMTDVFSPFVRGTNVNKIGGSGLGLSAVANAVKCINGSILLHSEVGKGTELTIVFPYNNEVSDFNSLPQKRILINHFETSELNYKQIIGTVSHELRTPIAILKSNIQLLKNLTFGIEDAKKDESIFMCEDSLKDMQLFLDSLPMLIDYERAGYDVQIADSKLSLMYVN